jgi:hypothetical protein
MAMTDERRIWFVASAAALASVGAGAIHVGAARGHAATSTSAFVFVAVVAIFQLAWGAAAYARHDRGIWTAGIVVNAAVAAVWLASRTIGVPGHHGGAPEMVGAADVLATTLESFVVGASFALRGRRDVAIASEPRRKRVVLAGIAAALALVAPLQVGAGESVHVAHRPHPSNVLEAFAKGKVVALTYAGYHCTIDPYDDLDGPGHEGDGTPAAEDRDELAAAPCILGKTRHGSLPKIDPTGEDARTAPRLYGLIPNFDSDGDGVTEDKDQTPTGQYHCPQPGPPVSRRKGEFPQCALHPPVHVEPVLRALAQSTTGVDTSSVDVPEGILLGAYHSHVIEYTSSPKRWWNIVAFNVDDASIFPDAQGHCPAKKGCLTSVEAIRAGQKAGKVEADIPSNLWFLFSVRPVAS